MSVEAFAWALNLAPIPKDPTGRPNSACAFVLVGLANHADSDGQGAFPSVETLCLYTRLSERTVRTALDRLESEGVIRRCSDAFIAAKITRGDRRPNGYDLALARVRDDLTPEQIARLSRLYPGLSTRVEEQHRGVQPLHLVPNGVQLTQERGATDDTHGVQLTTERGATVAPEPYKEPSVEPSLEPVARTRTTQQHRIPADWAVTPALRAYAADRCPGVDVDHEAESFRLHHEAKGSRFVNWDQAFQGWLRRATPSGTSVRPRRFGTNADDVLDLRGQW